MYLYGVFYTQNIATLKVRLIFALQRESGFATVLPAFFFTFFSKLKITLRSLCKIFPMLFFFYIPTYAKDSGRHICSSTDRSSPKSSISNAICILSYIQTGTMKRDVLTVWQPETSCKMLPVRCIHSRFGPDVDFYLRYHQTLSYADSFHHNILVYCLCHLCLYHM